VNNVLAYLPGKTDEYVIIGAHYDHLGRGNFDSLAPSQIGQIHPGADDNASGTAECSNWRGFSSQKGQLRRGILFMSFAGEELGLLGSAEWVKNPTRPLDKAVAMLNMDMIGASRRQGLHRRRRHRLHAQGRGRAGCRESLDSRFEYFGQRIFFQRSHFVCHQENSVLFFLSGLHSDYHKPSDTWEKIDPVAATRLLAVVGMTGELLADAEERPAFIVVAEDKPAGGSGGSGYGPYFGSIQISARSKPALKFSDVKPGSPAAKAGLKAGDILIQFGDKRSKTSTTSPTPLRRSKVGDVVEVKVLRDGQTVTRSVSWTEEVGARPGSCISVIYKLQ